MLKHFLSRLLTRDSPGGDRAPSRPEVPGEALLNGETAVFLHLQKTGGTSFHRLLTRHFPGERFVERDRSGKPAVSPGTDYRGRIISGHVTAHFVSRLEGRVRVVTVLRDPVERLLSHFYFLKSYTREHLETYENPLLLRLKEMDLATFLGDPAMSEQSADVYVRALDPDFDAAESAGAPADPGRAMAFLDTCEVVGVTPCLTGFAREVFLRWGIAGEWEIPFENRRRDLESQPGFEPVEEDEITPDLRDRLEELTRRDRLVYEHACRLAPGSPGHR